MGMNLTYKILSNNLIKGELKAGNEIAVRVHQTLTQDSTGTMAYLQLNSMNIEDVATPKEIEKAQHARLKEGKHIIPVPTMELKPHFRGYLIDPIKTMWRRRTLKKQDQDTLGQIGSEGFERSVVRPAFSYYGRLTFDDEVIIKLIRNGLKKVAGVDETSIISFKKSDKGQNGLVVDMAVVIEHGYPVKPLMQQVQKSVRNEIEYITGMSIERMSIKVKNIIETKRKIVKV